MSKLLFLTILVSAFAFAGEKKEFSPSEKFLVFIQTRQDHFEDYRTRLFNEEVCPGGDYSCLLKDLKRIGIQSSGDLDNGINLLSFIAQKKFKKGECKEICRMNIYAEYSAAMVDFLGNFDRKKIFVNLLPKDNLETKYLIINEELRFFRNLGNLHVKLISHYKKVDSSKIFNPVLVKRMVGLKEEISQLGPSLLLKDSYLSSLNEKDEVLKLVTSSGLKNEQEKLEKKELVSLFRSEIK